LQDDFDYVEGAREFSQPKVVGDLDSDVCADVNLGVWSNGDNAGYSFHGLLIHTHFMGIYVGY
jgi:hypothetical protein